jgi:hypothetical protein
MGEEVYTRDIITTYQVFGSVTNPATGTKSLSLPGQISVCNGFLHRHLDNFIFTWQIRTIYRDTPIWTTLLWHGNPAHLPGLCKNPLQVIGNLLYCRAVNNNTAEYQHIRLPALQVILFTVTRQFFAVYQFVPRRSTDPFLASFRMTNLYTLTIFWASLISLPTLL